MLTRGRICACWFRLSRNAHARGLSSCSFLHVFPQQSATPDSPVGLDSAGCASSSSAAGSAQVIATAVATATAAAGRPICLSAPPRAKPGLRTSWRSQLLRDGSRKGADPRSKIGPAVSCGPPVSAPTPRGLPRRTARARPPGRGSRSSSGVRLKPQSAGCSQPFLDIFTGTCSLQGVPRLLNFHARNVLVCRNAILDT